MSKIYYRKTYSLDDHISEIVPPTIVAPVDPNAPCKNRATMTVSIFFALIESESLDSKENAVRPYNASMGNMSKNPNPEPMYKGSRPNSSLKDAVTRGIKPKPSGYTLNPIVAWNSVQWK